MSKQDRLRVWLLLVLVAVAVAAWRYRLAQASERSRGQRSQAEIASVSDPERNEGLRLARMGDVRCEQLLRGTLQKRPGDAEVALGLGEVLEYTHRRDEAQKVLQQCVERNPSYAPGRMALGRLYARCRAYNKAVAQFEAACQADPTSADHYYWLGLCHSEMSQLSPARDALLRATKLAPSEAGYHALLGSVDTAMGSYDEAISEASRAAQLAADNPRIRANLAEILVQHHRSAEDLGQADKEIAAIQRLSPDHEMLPYLKGCMAMARGHYRESIPLLENARHRLPGNDYLYVALWQAYARSGRKADAENILSIRHQRDVLNSEAEQISQSLLDDPGNVALRERLAEIYVKLEDRSAAIAALRAALQINPSSASVQRRLHALRKAGRSDGTRTAQPGATVTGQDR